jgi:hypothetical protein
LSTSEAVRADLRPRTGYTATPPQNCLNGCERGSGDARGPVLCEPGKLLCSGKRSCTERLDECLRTIPDSFGLLLWVKDHGTVPGNPESARTKKPDAPAPMRLEVTDLLDQRPIWTRDDTGHLIQTENRRGALGLVHDWARRIRRDRLIQTRCGRCQHETGRHTWAPPLLAHCRSPHCNCVHYEVPVPTVSSECSLILGNLAWCTEQEWAGELYDELRQLNRTLTDTIGDYRAKPVGKCASLVDRPGVPVPVLCGGALVMEREGTAVKCVQCGKRHEANGRLRELGLIVGALFKDDGRNEREAS